MSNKNHYIVGFTRSSHMGREEYDGGHTLEDARREAAFFCEHLPQNVGVRIYKVVRFGDLEVVEVARHAKPLWLHEG